jgi:uncharacterized membrane protein YfcA
MSAHELGRCPAILGREDPVTAKLVLLGLLGVLCVVFTAAMVAFYRSAAARTERRMPSWVEVAIGFGTNFLDTLGIGSFAPTTALYKFLGLVSDERIPATLNVGHSAATFVQAFVFLSVVDVDPVTLVSLIGAALAGALLAAGRVGSWPVGRIRLFMALALVVAAALFAAKNLGWLPGGGERLGLSGATLAFAVVANFVLGALMMVGVGLYGPCMIMVSLLGMDPKAAFPIMMGSCAFLMPLSTFGFIRTRSFAPAPTLGLTVGGIPAVLIAAFVVKELPLTTLRWMVVAVVLIAAGAMVRDARATA